jgi:hypothetical protein
MQVLPSTFKAYNPKGNIDDPYDNSVGGLRYIKDLFNQTNDPGLTAVGYYGGPKAIEKAKAGIAVSDPRNPNAPNTLQYRDQVMGRTNPANATGKTAAGQVAPKRRPPPLSPMIRQNITDLGPGYQAALALMAKTDDLEDARERIAQEEDDDTVADFGQAKKMLAQLQPISAFKDGGEVDSESESAERLFRELNSARKEEPSVKFSYQLPPAQVVEGMGFMAPPPSVMGKMVAETEALGGKLRAGAQGVLMQTPDKKIVAMPGMYELGYNTKQGAHEFDLSVLRDIKAQQGRDKNYAVNARYSYKFAEGGEAKKESLSTGEKLKSTAKEVLRSMQYAPYDLLGAPVDIMNLGLKGVDYVTGSKLATEKPVGGSDYLIQKSRELGIADEPTGSTTESLTRMGMGILSPTAGPRAVAAAGKAVKGTAKAALEDLSMAATGQGGSQFAQKFATATGLDPKFAVRPKGGAYLGAKSVDEPSLSGFDIRVKDFTENLDRNDPLQKEVLNFFDKKLRNYVTNQQGTVDDPIFKKLLEGKIQNFTYESPEKFEAARAGNKEALKAVREAYDAAVPVNTFVGGKYGKTSSDLYKLEQNVASQIKAQSPDNYITTLMTQARRIDPTEIQKYSSLYGTPGFKQFSKEAESGPLQRILNKTDLPPHLRRAIAEGEPVYAMSGPSNVLLDRITDMSQIRDYLLNRSPAEIKNMGVADVVQKSAEWHAKLAAARRDPTNFSRKELYSGTEEVMPLSNNTKIVDVQTKDALALEGNIMKHCVGGSNYCNGVARGDIKIYSLRDRNGIPQATIELRMGSDKKYNNVFQVKGIEDKPVVEEFLPQIDEFLTTYSDKLGDTPLIINESPRFLPETWRNR